MQTLMHDTNALIVVLVSIAIFMGIAGGAILFYLYEKRKNRYYARITQNVNNLLLQYRKVCYEAGNQRIILKPPLNAKHIAIHSEQHNHAKLGPMFMQLNARNIYKTLSIIMVCFTAFLLIEILFLRHDIIMWLLENRENTAIFIPLIIFAAATAVAVLRHPDKIYFYRRGLIEYTRGTENIYYYNDITKIDFIFTVNASSNKYKQNRLNCHIHFVAGPPLQLPQVTYAHMEAKITEWMNSLTIITVNK